MQTTNPSITRLRFIILDKHRFTNFLYKHILIKRFKEITAFITKQTRFNNHNTLYISFYYIHYWSAANSSITFKRYCPYWFFNIG